MAQTGYAFLPLHNPGDYPQTMANSQEQAIRTKRFQQNQPLFRRCTAVDGAIKNRILTSVQLPVFTGVPVDGVCTDACATNTSAARLGIPAISTYGGKRPS